MSDGLGKFFNREILDRLAEQDRQYEEKAKERDLRWMYNACPSAAMTASYLERLDLDGVDMSKVKVSHGGNCLLVFWPEKRSRS